ncbi:AMP-binding protein [Streptomyces nogalater]
MTVLNEYGPTETTVGCTVFRIEPGDSLPPGVITIGTPVWNTRVYVLDSRLRPAPVGTPASCTSPVTWSPAATTTVPASPRAASWRTPTGPRAPGCTAPATSPAGPGRACWSSPAGSTTR